MSFYRHWGVVLALALLAGRASATDQAHFFDSARKPSVTFDKTTLTWTLHNHALERVVHFDTQTGALSTVALRDLEHNRVITPPAGSEGTITFADPILETPKPLVDGWQSTDTAPSNDWALPLSNTSGAPGWKNYTEQRLESGDKTHWFRCKIPADRMTEGHAYALVLDNAEAGFNSSEEVYIDGTLAAKIGPNDPPFVQIDLVPKNRFVAIKMGSGLSAHALIAEAGTSPPPLDLTSNWQYVLQAVNAGDNGSLILTISLSGVKQYEGFDINVSYEVFPGDEPFIAKWFEFNSHRLNRFLMEQVTYDRWPLPGTPSEQLQEPYHAETFSAAGTSSGQGIMTAVLSPMGWNLTHKEDNTVAVALRPYYNLKPNKFQMTPKSLIGLYHGPPETGLFLHQLFIAEYVTHGSAEGIPPVYSTGMGYGPSINAVTCAKLIPIAGDLGIKIFALGDGWQTNAAPDSGRYGDWVVDRGPDKFPEGLLPISTLIRERSMRLGLWMNATKVGLHSQIGAAREEWLTRPIESLYDDTKAAEGEMCFTSGWAETFTQSTRELCRELSVTYLQLEGSVASDACYAPLHDHPIGHRQAEELSHWADFCLELHKLDPAFTLCASEMNTLSAIGQQDTNGTWPGALPFVNSIAKDWYQSADMRRTNCYARGRAIPSFMLTGTAPCHLDKLDINALEYNLTTGCAYVGNMEIQGKLTDMTPEEQAVVQKWVKWNQDNRPWLAYSQSLRGLEPNLQRNAPPHIDGTLHLRNALDGRYGYLCLWNPSDKPDATTVSFHSEDYFVKMKEAIEILRVKTGKPVKFSGHDGAITLKDVPMAPHSWEIFEIRQRYQHDKPRDTQHDK